MSDFPYNWKLLALHECMSAIIDYRGVTPEKSSFGVPLVTAKIVKGGRLLEFNEYIPFENYDDWMRRGLPEPGDIVMTTEAPLGEIAQLGDRKVALGQRIITLRGKPNVLDNTFLKFLMQTEFIQSQLHGRETGTTVMGIKQRELRSITLVIPPFPEQCAIARILGALDDKIELNRRMNRTLESLAQSIFKSWFVDFDPVVAKSVGRQPYGMNAEMTALFPAKFIETQDGTIPDGWQIARMGELVTAVGGTTPSTGNSSFWEGGTIAWVTPRDMASLRDPVLFKTERKITEAGLQRISSGLLPVGTVLMSSRAPIGYLAISEIPVAINQGFIAMICNKGVPNHYVILWLDENMDTIISRANGTTFLEINKTVFRGIPVLRPPKVILDHFADFISKFYKQMTSNICQSDTLTSIRDTLLPKLLSGEIRLPQAEKIVERVV